jgi:RNA polymerase sigma-70 factor (ECF subfamily)
MLTFHDIYTEHAAHVYRFALFLTHDSALADDLVSETFLRAWSAADRMERATMRSYLLTITRNLHRDHIRREVRNTVLDEGVPAEDRRVDEGIDARAALARVLEASAKLSAIDRAVFFERVLEERPYQEIARRNGLSVAAVKVKVYRARLKLMLAR